MYKPMIDRFTEKTEAGPGGCILWTGAKTNAYGKLWDWRIQREVRAHRFAWEREHGPIPAGLCVCHHCDVRHCVNVEHLFLGTLADNLADMRAKGRGAKGETHGRRKLSAKQVAEIRAACALGAETQIEIAVRFSVTPETICMIHKRRTWK